MQNLEKNGRNLELGKCLQSEEYVCLAMSRSNSRASACAGIHVFQVSYRVQICMKSGPGNSGLYVPLKEHFFISFINIGETSKLSWKFLC